MKTGTFCCRRWVRCIISSQSYKWCGGDSFLKPKQNINLLWDPHRKHLQVGVANLLGLPHQMRPGVQVEKRRGRFWSWFKKGLFTLAKGSRTKFKLSLASCCLSNKSTAALKVHKGAWNNAQERFASQTVPWLRLKIVSTFFCTILSG